MSLQPVEDRLEQALAIARAARTADIRRDLGGALRLYRDAQELLDGVEATPLLANILRWQGSIHRDKGELDRADDLYRQSLEVAEVSGSLAAQAAATNCLATAAQNRGELEEAGRLYRSAARLAAKAGEFRLIGMIEQNLGVLSNIRGDLQEAKRRYETSLSAFEDAGDDEASTWVLNNLGMLYSDLGMPSRAEAAFRKGLARARARRDRAMEGILLTNYSEALIDMRRWGEAEDALEAAFTIVCEGEEPTRVAEVLKFRGVLERERGQHEQAQQRFSEALGVATRVRDRLLTGEVLRERCELHRRDGDFQAALRDLEGAIAAFNAAGAGADAARTRERLADLRALIARA